MNRLVPYQSKHPGRFGVRFLTRREVISASMIGGALCLAVFLRVSRFQSVESKAIPDLSPNEDISAVWSADGSAAVMSRATRDNPQTFTLDFENGTRQVEEQYYVDEAGFKIPHGTTRRWYKNGQLQGKGQWLDGKRHGEWIAQHKNGQQWVRGSFQDGKPIGTWEYWNEAGEMMGRRVDGIKTGQWTEINAQGDCFGRGEYKEGKLDGTWLFSDRANQPLMEINFRGGVVGAICSVLQKLLNCWT